MTDQLTTLRNELAEELSAIIAKSQTQMLNVGDRIIIGTAAGILRRATASETAFSWDAVLPAESASPCVVVPREALEEAHARWNGHINERAMLDALKNWDECVIRWLSAAPRVDAPPAPQPGNKQTARRPGEASGPAAAAPSTRTEKG